MTDRITIENDMNDIELTIDEVSTTPKGTRRYYLAALGTFATVGDKLASLVEGAIGPSFDRLVERGEALERDTLSSLTKPAQESLDAATDAGRQATRMASSTATTVADETRKQVVIAGNSVLEALSKQVEALRGSVDELRKTLPKPPANGDDSAA
jgi:hypothetical protein